MTSTEALLYFVLARLDEELAGGVDAARETEIQDEQATAPEIARHAISGEPGWEVYDAQLRQYASRYADHPHYQDEWRADPSAGNG
jgi:hypothetical protein